MLHKNLTARTIAGLREPGLYADGENLFLKIGPTGARSWIYRYWTDGRRRALGLGPAHLVTLAEAREKAHALGRQRLDGVDPATEKRAKVTATIVEAAKAMTFAEYAETYMRAHEAEWQNNKHRAQWVSTLTTYAYPVLGKLPVAAIDTSLVLKVLEPIWAEKPETASRVRGRIETILDAARVRGLRSGENPALWRGHLDKLLSAPSKAKRAARQTSGRGEHHAALPYREIAAFLAELREQKGVAARALEFAVLTAARTGEVLGATWAEINIAERVWIIPAARMKADKEHRVPLCDRAIDLLGAAGNGDEVVFPGQRTGKPLSNMAFLMLLRRMGRDDLTGHGFRSSFRDWAAGETEFQGEVAEMALAHAIGNKVEAAYRRGDLFGKRRLLMEAWARYCGGEGAADNVVPMVKTA